MMAISFDVKLYSVSPQPIANGYKSSDDPGF
jgi:hypothetical protein